MWASNISTHWFMCLHCWLMALVNLNGFSWMDFPLNLQAFLGRRRSSFRASDISAALNCSRKADVDTSSPVDSLDQVACPLMVLNSITEKQRNNIWVAKDTGIFTESDCEVQSVPLTHKFVRKQTMNCWLPMNCMALIPFYRLVYGLQSVRSVALIPLYAAALRPSSMCSPHSPCQGILVVQMIFDYSPLLENQHHYTRCY